MVKSPYHNHMLPPQPWEFDLADTTGFSLSQLRFALAFFASVPIAIILGRLRGAKLRHWFSLITGFALIYYPFGNGTLHAVFTTIVTYLLMATFRRHCGTLTWLFAMPYLIANHIAQASGMAWKEGHLDFTGAQMVLTLKLIAIAMCYQDGARTTPAEESSLREYAKSKRLTRLPTPLEFFSYCFAAGNLLSGPFFEARDYFEYMQGQGEWAPVSATADAVDTTTTKNNNNNNKKRIPSPVVQGTYRFFKALTAAVVWQMAERSGFTVSYLESSAWRDDTSLFMRMILLWFTVVALRFKYYFVWGVAESGLIFSKFGFSGFDQKGRATWDRYITARVRGVELNPSLADTPRHWNICTGLWLRHYVYERLASPGRKPTFYHLLLTQLVSGVWHGVFAGYWLFFATSALMFKASHVLHRYERNWSAKIRSFFPWTLVKIALTELTLNYAGSAFMVLSFSEAVRIWHSVYFFGHIWVVGLLIIGAVMPPRRPKKQDGDVAQPHTMDGHGGDVGEKKDD